MKKTILISLSLVSFAIFTISLIQYTNSQAEQNSNLQSINSQENNSSSDYSQNSKDKEQTQTAENFEPNKNNEDSSENTKENEEKENNISSQDSESENIDYENINQSREDELEEKNSFKTFSGQGFYDLYESFVHTGLQSSWPNTTITDNYEVDQYIINLAENRGYRKRKEARLENLIWVDGIQLQPQAAESWLKLKNNASKDGINLVLVSGYRSVDTQRSIFTNTLAPEYYIEDILNGEIDTQLDNILATRSIPGYSRHHTGYAIDLGCNSQNLVAFANTECYQWIKANNFEQAKKAGFIPSYPEGAYKQGPNPEEWEFVWIDKNLLIDNSTTEE